MSYKINFSLLRESFVLPSVIADKYLKMANEVQIKTILWIFRNSGESVDASQIAKKIGKSSAAVEEALLYWSSVGVLESDVMPESAKAVETAAPPAPKELPEIPLFAPSYEQIAKRCSESPELKSFFKEIQAILGKTLGYDGESSFVMMHDSYGLPFEVIIMLVSYCDEIGKSSYQYMNEMARSWGEREIDTLEKADEMVSRLKSVSKVWKKLSMYIGIDHPKPTKKQEEYLFRWTNDYKFSIEMICLAYENMANNCTSISFAYMDAVLKSWYSKGYMTPDDVRIANEAMTKVKTTRKSRNKTFTSTSYDIDDFKDKTEQLPVYNSKGGIQK